MVQHSAGHCLLVAQVTFTNSKVVVTSEGESSGTIIAKDLAACKAVVHVVDGVLAPIQVSQTRSAHSGKLKP